MFGTWASLLGMFINVGTGHADLAIRSQLSGAGAMAWDLITGRDYDYEPTRETPAGFAKYVAKSFVPFAAEQVPGSIQTTYEGVRTGNVGQTIGGVVGAASQIGGVKSYPEPKPPKITPATIQERVYTKIENQIWSQYPSNLRMVSQQINSLEQSNPSEAKKLLYRYPAIMLARKRIALQKRQWKALNAFNTSY